MTRASLKCERCGKRLSRKAARMIGGKVLCSPCVFAPLSRAEQTAAKLTRAQRRAILEAEEIARGELNVNCDDDVLYELGVDELVNDMESDALTPLGIEVRCILQRSKS